MRLMQDPNFTKARVGLCLLGLLALPLLAGCGGGGGGSSSSPTPTPIPTPTPTPTPVPTPPPTTSLSTSVITPTGLTATLSEASSTVSVNGNLTYTLTLTNSTAAAIPVHSNGLNIPAAGLIIRNSSGTPVYFPVPAPAPVINGTLAAGQSLTETVSANGFTAAGTYEATATFSDDITPKYAATVGPLAVTAQ